MKYEILFSKEKSKNYALGVFVLNEGVKFIEQMKRISEIELNCDVVVIDGGSTDGSIDEEMLASLNVNACLIKQEEGGLGTQMRMFFEWAGRRSYQGLVLMDGNGKDGLKVINSIVEKLERGFDHVQGSRFIDGGHHENTPLSRLLAVRFLHAPLISLASGVKQTDTTNGCRGYSMRLVDSSALNLSREVFKGYELHYFIAVNAPKHGFTCAEVPAERCYPSSGKVPTKISPIVGNLKVLFLLFKVVIGGYRA